MKCPYCGSDNLIVEGKFPAHRLSGTELYRCENCKHRFTKYCVEAHEKNKT